MDDVFVNGSEFWDSGLKVMTECGKAPKDVVVYLKPVVKRKIDILMNKYQSREWLAYLIGKNNIIDDIIFPKQKASAASVSDIEFPSNLKEKIIGVIHSHHSMGTFFSGTDHEYINGNHDISIVVSKNGFGCDVRWNTPCGGKITIKAKVKIYLHTNFNEDAFVKDVEEKMELPVPIYTTFPPRFGGSSYWLNERYSKSNNLVKDDEPPENDDIPPSLKERLHSLED